MTQQVFVVHGGDAFNTYEEYISFLNAYEVSLERLQTIRWRSKLQSELGDDFEVYLLQMPNYHNAKYFEWKLWFEKYIPLMNENMILVGTSLGAVFLAKYLSEENFPKKIKSTYLVAPPYNEDGGKPLPEFSIVSPLHKLEEQAGKLFFYHSKDDPVVAFSEFEKYQKELPSATFRIFEDRKHFNQGEFPEIVEDIKIVTGQ